MNKQTSAQARYLDLALRREPFLRRARDCAALTIPALMPPEGHNPTQTLPQPNQGLGSAVVVHLSNKTMTALLPVGMPFYRLGIPMDMLLQSGQSEIPADLEQQLALAEKLIMSEIERRNWRAPTTSSLEQLIVTGNVLENLGTDNSIRTFRLDQYVVDRDIAGNLIEVITCLAVHPMILTEAQKSVLDAKTWQSPTTTVKLYTWSRRQGDGRWVTHQEVDDKKVPKSERVTNLCPFMALRWSMVPGEPYGRGKVEQHYADLLAYDTLWRSMLDLSSMAAKHVVLIRPNASGNNLRRFLDKAKNGDVGVGNAEDVQLVKFENVQSAQFVSSVIDSLGRSLSQAFLMTNGIRRDAERVTAEEIRTVVEELEGTQGGVYSLLSEDMQRARLVRLMENMTSRGQLPQSFGQMVDPQIIVGLPALSRERDAIKAQQALTIISQLPPEMADYVKESDVLKTLFVGMGLPGSVRTDAEVQQRRQERLMMEAAAQMQGQMPQLPPQATEVAQ